MPEDRTKPHETRGTTNASAEDIAVEALALRHSISADQARELIDRFGRDPARLGREARKLTPPVIDKAGRASP